ncbi:MAG: c-type cytochrome [Acidobacteria bacterium]|nr:c-type cytochrome [Acidobacteriota bacterium]
MRRILSGAGSLALVAGLALPMSAPSEAAQNAPATPAAPAARGGRQAGPQAPAGGGRGRATFPAQQRPPADPALVARGQSLYSVSCTSCHGGDLRGGQLGGPNLLRSPVVLADDLATLLQPILQGSRAERGMPAIPLPPDAVNAVAAYLHSVVAQSRGQGAPPPGPPVVLNVLVGDPAAGAAYFAAKCSTCHSPTGDLQGLASRVPDPKALQNLWVAGGGGRGAAASPRRIVTATVTPASGPAVSGRLVKIDDFIVTLALGDGRLRSFGREREDVPRVEIRDPLSAHRDLLRVYTNKDMHDVTAYLATLK